MVSGLSFKSLIHFKSLFVSGIRQSSNFILLHVDIQFSQHHVLKRLSILGALVKDQLTTYAWVYFQVLKSDPLIYMLVFMPEPYYFNYYSFLIQFEIRKYYASSFVLLSQDCFGYWGSFVVSYNFRKVFSISVKNAIGILIGSALYLQIALGSMDILTTLILLIQEHEISFPFICVFFHFFHQCHSFQCTGLSPPWLYLFLSILLFLMPL